MHIVIAAITAIAGLCWALNSLQRSGFDFNSLNPFLLFRRLTWSREYGAKPIFKLDSPMDVAALLLVAMAKADGVMSTQQKQALLSIFQESFEISNSKSSELLLASIHLLRNELSITVNIDKILDRSKHRFAPDQIDSLLALMRKIAAMDGSINAEQQQMLAATERCFAALRAPSRKWQ